MSEHIDAILKAKFTQTIDGVAAATQFEPVIDPSTGKVFQQSPAATAEEIDLAVSAARRAQPAWAALSWDERHQYLERLADAIDENRSWLASVQTMEQGIALPASLAFVAYVAQCLRVIGKVRAQDRLLIDDDQRKVTQSWRPLGVVAAIAPWNAPLVLGIQKVAAALIGGNAIVLKPSELTPLATLELGRIGREVLPPGVFNVIGGGRAVGQAMVDHSGFDKASFTGSTATGIAIAKAAAAYLRPVTLELGGNDAAILLPDGSIDALVATTARIGLVNRGQFCAAVKRIYAPTALYDQVCDALVAAVRDVKIGNGFEPDVQMGPIQNEAQFEKICDFVDDARAAGGRILTGGKPLEREGYFYPPTIIAGLTDGVRIVDEEQFGPIIPVIAYDDLEAVIATINAGQYGLTGSIWTADVARGAEIASRLVVGTGWVNQHGAFDTTIPFPLIKASGMGVDFADCGVTGAMRMQIISARKDIA
ncbi:MAG: aldehyde dehydrogenase family protein [Sphingomicrobium sp.]